MKVLKKKKRRGRLIVLNKAAKIVLKIQKREHNEIALTIVSKPSLEQFHEKQRLEAPETPTTPLLSLPNTISSSQICKGIQKRYSG